MITVKLLGGLGNQMFQAAFALALESRGYAVQLDKSSLIEGTHREYSLDYFGDIKLGAPQDPRIYEKSLKYDPTYLSPVDPCTLVGYWQSQKYFALVEYKVRNKFQFKNPVLQQESIAIHIRRQDYVNLQKFHGMPPINYYRDGVKYIRQQVGVNLGVDVFSDDPQWCRENFPQDFHIVEGNSKYDDMKLMAAHNYHVIANSSFSWWGAYLGPQKLVVAPKQWFSTPDMDATDIVPTHWVRL